jgi:hypothetical protein
MCVANGPSRRASGWAKQGDDAAIRMRVDHPAPARKNEIHCSEGSGQASPLLSQRRRFRSPLRVASRHPYCRAQRQELSRRYPSPASASRLRAHWQALERRPQWKPQSLSNPGSNELGDGIRPTLEHETGANLRSRRQGRGVRLDREYEMQRDINNQGGSNESAA